MTHLSVNTFRQLRRAMGDTILLTNTLHLFDFSVLVRLSQSVLVILIIFLLAARFVCFLLFLRFDDLKS